MANDRRWRYTAGPWRTTAEESIVPEGCDEFPRDGEVLVPEAEVKRLREALEWIANDVDEGEMRKWAWQALEGEPLTDVGK